MLLGTIFHTSRKSKIDAFFFIGNKNLTRIVHRIGKVRTFTALDSGCMQSFFKVTGWFFLIVTCSGQIALASCFLFNSKDVLHISSDVPAFHSMEMHSLPSGFFLELEEESNGVEESVSRCKPVYYLKSASFCVHALGNTAMETVESVFHSVVLGIPLLFCVLRI